MSEDPLPYGLYYRDALRSIMARALAAVAVNGLPDDHYFHITFRTDHPGVVMPKALRAQYPAEMAIILQHVFQDLEVDDAGFSVTLSFNRRQQRLTVPFESVMTFQDPPASVVLTFLDADEMAAAQPATGADPAAAATPDSGADDGAEPTDGGPGKGDNVIAIDHFRKS